MGNSSHYVAVRPDRDEEPVRKFDCFTADLHRLADWLQSCRVKTVAIAYASHCTSLGRCETFSVSNRLLDNLTPRALRGGLGPGSSSRYSFLSLHRWARRRPAARQILTCLVEMPSRSAISSRVSIPFSRKRSKRLLSPYSFVRRAIIRRQNGLPPPETKPRVFSMPAIGLVRMLVQQTVDLGNHGPLRYVGPKRERQLQRPCGASREANVDQELFSFDQGHVFQEKPCQSLALSIERIRILPQTWKIRRHSMEPSAQLFIDRHSILLALLLWHCCSYSCCAS
jgi:hypothetical protein